LQEARAFKNQDGMSSGQKYTPDPVRNFNRHPQKSSPARSNGAACCCGAQASFELLKRASPGGRRIDRTALIAVSGSGFVRRTSH
jgi:hypothetical protein